MATIDITAHLAPSRYKDEPDRWKDDGTIVLVMHSRYVRRDVRFGVLYQGPGGTVRVESNQDEQPGPYGWLIPQPAVIAIHHPAPPAEILVTEGDTLVINHQRMVAIDDRKMHYPRLVTEAEAAALTILHQVREQLVQGYRGQPGTEEDNARRNERQAVLTGVTKLINDQLPALRTAYAAPASR